MVVERKQLKCGGGGGGGGENNRREEDGIKKIEGKNVVLVVYSFTIHQAVLKKS